MPVASSAATLPASSMALTVWVSPILTASMNSSLVPQRVKHPSHTRTGSWYDKHGRDRCLEEQ